MIDSLSADFEHEIPNGSRLYFGKNAALKRKIENIASEILLKNDFNEILTPCFSYHQNLGVKSGLLKFSDPQNNEIALREMKRGKASDILNQVLDSLEFLCYVHK